MIQISSWWLFHTGCNGSGKTTLAWNLKEDLEKEFGKCLLFDLGRFLTEDPAHADQIAKGNLVPDEEVLDIMVEHTALVSDIQFRLIVGWPRNIVQARHVIELIRSRPNDRALLVDVDTPLHICQERMKGQSGRSDNTEAARSQRIRTFKNLTVPAINLLKTQMHCVRVDGTLAPPDVLRDARMKLYPRFEYMRSKSHPHSEVPLNPIDIPQAPL